MVRAMIGLIFVVLLPGVAKAFSPDGASAVISDFGGRHGFSLEVQGVDSTRVEGFPEINWLQVQGAALGLTWSAGGTTVGIAAGHMVRLDYSLPGLFVSSSLTTEVRLGQAIGDVAGGAAVLEFSARRHHYPDGYADRIQFGLRWSRPF